MWSPLLPHSLRFSIHMNFWFSSTVCTWTSQIDSRVTTTNLTVWGSWRPLRRDIGRVPWARPFSLHLSSISLSHGVKSFGFFDPFMGSCCHQNLCLQGLRLQVFASTVKVSVSNTSGSKISTSASISEVSATKISVSKVSIFEVSSLYTYHYAIWWQTW